MNLSCVLPDERDIADKSQVTTLYVSRNIIV